MPLQATSGAASYDGFGGGVAAVPTYIEDVFSTYLYTGDGSSAQNINNGIDLSGKGGMVWVKSRSNATTNVIVDTSRFVSSSNIQCIFSDSTSAASASANEFGSFNSNGFSIPYNTTAGWTNFGTRTFVSWTFRKQPKFFDVVTYTGTGSARTIAHNLGSVPGCIIVKRTDAAGYNWFVYHVSLGNSSGIVLNQTGGAGGYGTALWNSTDPTSTVFSLGTNSNVNASGGAYVAYLFAHDAGGFGLTGTDNVISCGSYTGNGSATGTLVNLGFEPQWLLVKMSSDSGYYWELVDNMRGIPTGGNDAVIWPNVSDAEYSGGQEFDLASNGFYPMGAASNSNVSGQTYIYIAIRRGPMKVPTLGTSVYNANPFPADAATNNTVIDPGFPVDLVWLKPERSGVYNWYWQDRLRGKKYLYSNATDAEVNSSTKFDYSNGYVETVSNSSDGIGWAFRRAPGFFDEVCYTGTGTAGQTYTHNLGVVPELMIVKGRSIAEEWNVYYGVNTTYLKLNRTDVPQTATTRWNDTSPTSSVFSVGTSNWVNGSGSTYVAYLFATLAGVSKVFSYTGNGSSQTINCGFTGGARFVLIKRTDPTGDWYVWDSARGIVAGNDPHLSLNTTAAEVTTDDSVDTDTTGFIVNQVAATNVNVSSATYIGLAIA